MIIKLSEPYYIHGPGKLKMSSVKQIEGTANYLDLAEKKDLCQNDTSIQDCMAEKFYEKSLNCKCVPFKLIDFYPKVFIYQYQFYKQFTLQSFLNFRKIGVHVCQLAWSALNIFLWSTMNAPTLALVLM